METRQFGQTDIRITPIGFGTWAIGGGNWEFAWGPQDDAQSVAAIQKALDLGVNWIDTAAVYGLGHAEEVVGRALTGRPTRPYKRVWQAERWHVPPARLRADGHGLRLAAPKVESDTISP